MGWLRSPPVAHRKPVNFTTRFRTAFPTRPFLLEPASHGAGMLHSVTSQPFWPSSPLMFVQQEKLPDRLTSSAANGQNTIHSSPYPSTAFSQHSHTALASYWLLVFSDLS